MLRVALIVLLIAPVAGAQTVELSGGTGNLFEASGAKATMYMPGNQASFSFGYQHGRGVVLGASDAFLYHGTTIVAGSQMSGFSFSGAGIGLALTGISATRQFEHTTLSAFAGSLGVGFSAPYLNTVRPEHIGVGLLLQKHFCSQQISQNKIVSCRWAFYSMTVLNGGQLTAAEGVTFQSRKLNLAASGGTLQNHRFYNLTNTYSPTKWASVYASHQNFSVENRNAVSDNIGASITAGKFFGSISANGGSSGGIVTTGESASVGVHLGPVFEQSMYFTSPTSGRLLSHNFTEIIRHHLTLTQTISQSSQGNSYSFGGGYTTNRFSFSVNRSVELVIGRGFESTTGFSLNFRIHDTVINVQTVTDILGHASYAAWAESYVQTGLQSGQSNQPGQHHVASQGKYRITGRCVRESGAPQEGCTIQIGKAVVYSDSNGDFELRMKNNKPVLISVPLDQFITPGEFQIVSAPQVAQPGTEIVVTVKRM